MTKEQMQAASGEHINSAILRAFDTAFATNADVTIEHNGRLITVSVILPNHNAANPTREQLDEQIAALTAQRDAMLEMVRIYWPGTHYCRDFPLVDGVPYGFVEVKK